MHCKIRCWMNALINTIWATLQQHLTHSLTLLVLMKVLRVNTMLLRRYLQDVDLTLVLREWWQDIYIELHPRLLWSELDLYRCDRANDGTNLSFCEVHGVMTSWRGNAFRITGLLWRESPVDSSHKWSAMRIVDIPCDVSLNKLLNKQYSFRWFKTPWRAHVTLL